MDFVLVDLFSQLDAVNLHTRGWGQDQILEWLRHFGQVESLSDISIGASHVFRSPCGLETPFALSDTDEIVLPGFVRYMRADENRRYW